MLLIPGDQIDTLTPNMTPKNSHKIKPVVLLSIYGIVPLILLLIFVDYFFFDLRFSKALPNDSDNLQWLNLLFQLPHVIASLITFCDRDYISAYKPRLTVALPLIAVAILVLPWLTGVSWFVFLVTMYAYYHQVAQQTGVALLIARSKPRTYEVWKWSSIVLTTGLYFIAIAKGTPLAKMVESPQFGNIIKPAAAIFMASFSLVSIVTALGSKTRVGKYYIGANTAMLFVYCLVFFMDIPFYMVLIPRLVHDLTAFSFYIAHNANRNEDEYQNVFSKVRRIIPLPEYLYTPAVSIIFTALLAYNIKGQFFLYSFLAISHYYIEGFMWKHGSPHRQYIAV